MRRRHLLVPLVAIPLALAACGGSKSSSNNDTSTPADLTVTAPGGLKWDAKQYTLNKSGNVSIRLVNKDQQSHALDIRDSNGKKVDAFRLLAAGGSSKQGTVNLPPGTYEVYCDIPGHAPAGMKATLTVG